MALQHQHSISIVLEGRELGPFRAREGGGKTSEANLVRPGGMAAPEAFSGPYTYPEMTLRRRLKHGVDSGLYQWVVDRVGDRFAGSDQLLDQRGRAGFHRPTGFGGVITGVVPNDFDADGTDPEVLEFTIQPDSLT